MIPVIFERVTIDINYDVLYVLFKTEFPLFFRSLFHDMKNS